MLQNLDPTSRVPLSRLQVFLFLFLKSIIQFSDSLIDYLQYTNKKRLIWCNVLFWDIINKKKNNTCVHICSWIQQIKRTNKNIFSTFFCFLRNTSSNNSYVNHFLKLLHLLKTLDCIGTFGITWKGIYYTSWFLISI